MKSRDLSYVPRCPRHERYPFDDCAPCDNLAAKIEPREYGDEPEIAADRYERWLDRIAP